jgi:hypothetical protein
MRIKYARNTALFALVLVMVSPSLLFGQATGNRPSPATIATAKQRLIEMQSRSGLLKRKGCEPGPPQALIPPPGWFESVTTANNGDVYTSDQAYMRVYRITRGNDVRVFANLFGDDYYDPQASYAGTLGLEFDRNGNLWVVVLDYLDTEKHGIYVVTPHGHSELAIPMDPNVIPIPNGLTFDDRGNLYVTESATGAIWKVARGSHVPMLWLTHELLSPPQGGAFGANGIVYKDKSLFVVNTDKGILLRVPLNRDGSPGEPTVRAQLLDPLGATIGPDGLRIGPDYALYATGAYEGLLVRIAEDGSWKVVLDGLAYPTGVAFGKTRGERDTVYLSNLLATINNEPGVVKVDLCER